MKTPSTLPYVWMLCASLSFTLMGELTYKLRADMPWQLIAIVRAALAMVLAALLVRASGARFVFLRPRTLWMRSIAGSLSLVSFFFALTRLPTSEVLTMSNMFPIWVAFLSWPMLGEAPSGRVWLSIASGSCGVVLIQQPHFAEGNFATLVALAASFFTAVAMMGLHRLRGIDPPAIVAHFSAVSVLFCLPAFFLTELHQPNSAIGFSSVLMLLGVGLTATIGQIFLTRAFTGGMPAKVSVVGLSQVVFSVLYEAIYEGRDFSALTLWGMVLVLAPTAWLLIRRR